MTQKTLFSIDEPLLVGVSDEAMIGALRQRGYTIDENVIFAGEIRSLERLADLIANGSAAEALDLLRELAPEAPFPCTTMFLRDLRASQFEV